MHVTYLIDSLVGGGAEQSLAALAPRYAARGVQLDIAYLKDKPGLQDEMRRGGATLFCLEGPGGRAGWIARARRLLRERCPDVVHTTLFEADIAGRAGAWMTGIPVVSSLVNPQYGPEQLNDPRLRAWKVRATQVADAVTAQRVVRWHAITGYVADLMSARLRVPRDRIDVIPRGRDPKLLGVRSEERRAGARAALGVANGERVIVAAARQEYQKGLDVLLRSFDLIADSVPDAVLFIAGREGNQSEELRKAAAGLASAGRVHLLGVRRDVPDLLCAADTFVLPSRWEGLGSVLLEAMALEAPIVASDLPAVREVAEGVAELVEPEDHRRLAEAISATLLDGDSARMRAIAARARFLERFDIDAVADEMIAFYERALGPKARVAGVGA